MNVSSVLLERSIILIPAKEVLFYSSFFGKAIGNLKKYEEDISWDVSEEVLSYLDQVCLMELFRACWNELIAQKEER